MNRSQKLVVFVEGLLLIVLALLIQSLFPNEITSKEIALRIGLVLLVFYSFRRGAKAGIIASFVFGLAHAWWLLPDNLNTGVNILLAALPSVGIGLAGLFARNLQRTLHNKRMKSVYLNLVTGTLLTLVVYFGIRLAVMYFAINPESLALSALVNESLWSFGMNFGMTLVILILLLNIQAKYFIPKNTPYISRKERSRLLND